MKLALSVRIAEGFLSKEESILDLDQVTELAKAAGYHYLCMRGSQIGVHSSAENVDAACKVLQEAEMPVSMVTGNFDIVYNNDQGPNCLRNISPFVDLANRLGATMLRVALKKNDDIEWAQKAADEAAKFDLRLVHQCHTLSLFETVDGIEETLRAIDRPNFGVIYEPANLELCGQSYGLDTLERLKPWIFNVYLQNQLLKTDGKITLDTWCRGPSSFDLIQIHEPGGINFDIVFDGLKKIGYDGTVTVHQSAKQGDSPIESAQATAQFLLGKI